MQSFQEQMQANFVVILGHYALVELNLRMLLDRSEPIARDLDGKFVDLLKELIHRAVVRHPHFTRKEKRNLGFVCTLRNALLHGDTTAAARLLDTRFKLGKAGIFQFNLDRPDAEAHDIGSDTHDAGLFAHYLLLSSDRYAEPAMKVALEALAAIDRVAMHTALQE